MGITERVMDKIIHNHHMIVENRLCSRFRTVKSDCSLCADLCPGDAIVVSEKGAEIRGGCTDCGICISSCPNGAFTINGRDDNKISNEIEKAIQKSKDSSGQEVKIFTISCEHGDETSDLILPCLSRLTEALLLEPVKIGIARIEILQPFCEECSFKKAATHLEKVIRRSNSIYEMLNMGSDRISIISIDFRRQRKSESTTKDIESTNISRGQFFNSIRKKTLEIAADAIPDLENDDKGTRQMFKSDYQNKPENHKRTALLRSIRDIAAMTGNEQETVPNKKRSDIRAVEVPSKECMIAEIEVSSKCTACGVCSALCPTGAVIQSWTRDNFNLSFRSERCTNCHVCVDVCMPEALKIKDKTPLVLLLEQAEVKLFEASKKRCPVCKMDFIGGELEICPLCINIHNKQMAALQDFFKKEDGCERI